MRFIKKILALGLMASSLPVISVVASKATTSSENWAALRRAMIAAEKRLKAADEALSKTDADTYYYFVKCPWSHQFQMSEKILRCRFPAEYNEYISAKAELEDLKYLYTVAVANDISSKNEK